MKRHSEEGADLLKRLQLVDKMPMIVAYEHHQRHDLLGYPDDRAAQEQHLFSKIVAVCDAYDAMTTTRPFRREIRPDKALAVLMQGRGKAYDPSVTKALVAMLGIYPDGRGRDPRRRLDGGRLPRQQRRPAPPAREGAHRRRAAAGSRPPRCSTCASSTRRRGCRCTGSMRASRRPRPASTTSGSTSRPTGPGASSPGCR